MITSPRQHDDPRPPYPPRTPARPFLRPFSITKGWLPPAIQVSPQYGNKKIWPGDAFGISILPTAGKNAPERISLTWASAIKGHKNSEIYGAVVTLPHQLRRCRRRWVLGLQAAEFPEPDPVARGRLRRDGGRWQLGLDRQRVHRPHLRPHRLGRPVLLGRHRRQPPRHVRRREPRPRPADALANWSTRISKLTPQPPERLTANGAGGEAGAAVTDACTVSVASAHPR
jgi:hypothetical protein